MRNYKTEPITAEETLCAMELAQVRLISAKNYDFPVDVLTGFYVNALAALHAYCAVPMAKGNAENDA